jgi:hypothetical protein
MASVIATGAELNFPASSGKVASNDETQREHSFGNPEELKWCEIRVRLYQSISLKKSIYDMILRC